MGNFSRDTFNQLRHYVGVRLQQGVPIVDADWNEQEDIRKHELRTFLKWFVGNGVPKGNDGFRIVPLDGSENDFTIKGGTTEEPGYCLVEGWDAMIEEDIDYTQQLLYNNDTLARELGVDPLRPLSPPNEGERTDTVYLDVWEREVDAQDDENLVNQAIGIETCVRLKREWVVRVAQGVTEPPSPSQGHVYYPIARLNRKAGINTIAEQDIRDLRQTGLSLQHNIRGTISSTSKIENVTTSHTRQVNVSYDSTASGPDSQVNAGYASTASNFYSQVNASQGSIASGEKSQVNASFDSTAGKEYTQVNASISSKADSGRSQVNASAACTTSNSYSQVNASQSSIAGGERSQINASSTSTASGNESQVNASDNSTASGHYSQINASYQSRATNWRSQVNASIDSIASGEYSQANSSSKSQAYYSYSQVNACHVSKANQYLSQVNASCLSSADGSRSQVNACGSSNANGRYSQVNASYSSTASGIRSQVNASAESTASGPMSQVNASANSAATHWNSQVNASISVATADHNTVCGGYGEGDPSTANRKWELNSKNGTLTLENNVVNSFSDYGEYFENSKKGEIDMGLLIALDGAKVRTAKKDEDFIGVVSGTAAIRLGDSPFCWQGRYMKDEWGRPVYKKIKDPAWKPKTIPDEKWQPKEGETEADRPMIAVETEEDRPTIRVQKENPDYDPEKEQLPRSERPNEWTLVGFLGQVYVRCDETVKPGDFVKSKGKGIGTTSDKKTGLRAMKVTKPFDGKYSIVYCLLR
jgi:hypothetical protein